MRNSRKEDHPLNRKRGRPRLAPTVVVSARVPLALAAWIREWSPGPEGWGRAMVRLAQSARNHIEGRVDLGEAFDAVKIAKMEKGEPA